MEPKSSKNQVNQLWNQEKEERVVSIKNAEKLEFLPTELPKTTFKSFDGTITIMHQRDSTKKVIAAIMGKQLKLYQIKDGRVSFASSHTIENSFVDVKPKKILTTEKSISLYYSEEDLKINDQNHQILREEGVDLRWDTSTIIAQIPIGTTEPELIKLRIETRTKSSPSQLISYLMSSNTILGAKLCLLADNA